MARCCVPAGPFPASRFGPHHLVAQPCGDPPNLCAQAGAHAHKQASKMGGALSSLTECLGAFGGGSERGYARVAPTARRVEGVVQMRSAPPPPLVPDKHAVYDLLDEDDEDVCPTCLEAYTSENPKITSECGHSFHLQCIVRWQTRSGSTYCPICAQPMAYSECSDVYVKPA